jgi:hypothetical protein
MTDREIKRCERCNKIISGNRGRPNHSGICSNCKRNGDKRRHGRMLKFDCKNGVL